MHNIDKPDTLHGLSSDLISQYTSPPHLQHLVRMALEEDIGAGDLTDCIFDSSEKTDAARLVAKSNGILSGGYLVDAVFQELNTNTKVEWHFPDGSAFTKGGVLATITGPITALLQGERVGLNFLQRMSGIATLTNNFVKLVGEGNNKPRIFDTRKTTPLLRAFEKRAVIDGGGSSHRFALYDMAMLKDNHIDAAGSITAAVANLEQNGFFDKRPRLGLCIEVRNISEAIEAMESRADIIMLDNMSPAEICDAAKVMNRRAQEVGVIVPELEISGGITLQNIKEYSELPVQRISVGTLTHSAPALDISMLYAKN